MFFLIGEQVRLKSQGEGQFDCPVCVGTQQYRRLAEVNYFTLFLIPIAPLSKLADYCQCNQCGNSFVPDNYSGPAYLGGVRRALVYIMLGYSMEEHKDTVRKLWQKLTTLIMSDRELALEIDAIKQSKEDIFSFMKAQAYHLNVQGKEKIIEAAFLMTYASCEIEHQDRLRVNLIGNALGMPLEFVETIVNRIRASNYYGIKRNLVVS
jgi:hypothetical protein